MIYHQQTKKYIRKVIRIRKRLIAGGESRMNKALAWQHINHLEKYLKAYGYNDDNQMAGFWRRNRGKIMDLLPGVKSASHHELVNEFNNIDSTTMHIDAPTKRTTAHVY